MLSHADADDVLTATLPCRTVCAAAGLCDIRPGETTDANAYYQLVADRVEPTTDRRCSSLRWLGVLCHYRSGYSP